jgi:hypothetical protein
LSQQCRTALWKRQPTDQLRLRLSAFRGGRAAWVWRSGEMAIGHSVGRIPPSCWRGGVKLCWPGDADACGLQLRTRADSIARASGNQGITKPLCIGARRRKLWSPVENISRNSPTRIMIRREHLLMDAPIEARRLKEIFSKSAQCRPEYYRGNGHASARFIPSSP